MNPINSKKYAKNCVLSYLLTVLMGVNISMAQAPWSGKVIPESMDNSLTSRGTPGLPGTSSPTQDGMVSTMTSSLGTMNVNNIRVHVYGAVLNPGIFSLNILDRLTAAIGKAGGIKENASERRIEIRRGGVVKQRIDLLSLRKTGNLADNPVLNNNDLIFVPYIQNTVKISGPVVDPGLYEITKEKTLKDIIGLASGFLAGVDFTKKISVIRFDSSEKLVIPVENTEASLSQFEIKNGDTINIPHKFSSGIAFDYSVEELPLDNISYPSRFKKIYVIGGVRAPQAIDYFPGTTLAQYVSLSGGLDRLGREDVIVTKVDGSKTKTTIDQSLKLSPGDTINVGQNKLGPDFWITFMTSLIGLSISSYAILR